VPPHTRGGEPNRAALGLPPECLCGLYMKTAGGSKVVKVSSRVLRGPPPALRPSRTTRACLLPRGDNGCQAASARSSPVAPDGVCISYPIKSRSEQARGAPDGPRPAAPRVALVWMSGRGAGGDTALPALGCCPGCCGLSDRQGRPAVAQGSEKLAAEDGPQGRNGPEETRRRRCPVSLRGVDTVLSYPSCVLSSWPWPLPASS
jgi:hypothetical protein